MKRESVTYKELIDCMGKIHKVRVWNPERKLTLDIEQTDCGIRVDIFADGKRLPEASPVYLTDEEMSTLTRVATEFSRRYARDYYHLI